MKLFLKAPIKLGDENNSCIMSPLGMACLHCKAGNLQHLEVIKLLVNSGADLNDIGHSNRNSGYYNF
jgi:ankyrin repeat protein